MGVIEELSAMRLTETFLREADWKISLARRAQKEILLRLRDLETFDEDGLWYHIDSLMGSVTSVANIFWPSTKNKVAVDRAKSLVVKLDLTMRIDQSLREVRNGSIHFDERLDEWNAKSEHKNLMDRGFNDLSGVYGLDAGDYARNFNPSTWVVSNFRSTSSDLNEAMKVLQHVHARISIWNVKNEIWKRTIDWEKVAHTPV